VVQIQSVSANHKTTRFIFQSIDKICEHLSVLIAPAGEIYPLCGDVLRRRASKSGASIKQFFSTFFGFNKTEISSNGSSVILVTHDVIVKHLFALYLA